MKTKRLKIALTAIATRDEAEAIMNELAVTANDQRKLTAQRDQQKV